MNTSKQINIMVALVFLSVLATGAYTMWDPDRTADARKGELHRTIERGAFLFSQNCVVCHGDSGEGGSASNRLKVAPAINRPDLQGIDPKTGLVSETDKAQQFKFIVNTITCGRIGKAMPTWGQSQGGTLNDEQIRQLATMITEGTGWEMSKEFAIEGDHEFHYTGYASAGIKLTQALDASSTTVFLSDVSVLGKGLRIAVPLPGEDPAEEGTPKVELMLITENPNKDQKSVVVERGLGTTSPVAHDAGAAAWLPPVPPDPGADHAARLRSEPAGGGADAWRGRPIGHTQHHRAGHRVGHHDARWHRRRAAHAQLRQQGHGRRPQHQHLQRGRCHRGEHRLVGDSHRP